MESQEINLGEKEELPEGAFSVSDTLPLKEPDNVIRRVQKAMTPQNSFTSSSGDNTYSRSQSSESSPKKAVYSAQLPPRPVPKPRTSIQSGASNRRKTYERSKSVDLEQLDSGFSIFNPYGSQGTMNSTNSLSYSEREHSNLRRPQPTPRKSVQKRIELCNDELFNNNPKMQVYPSDLLFRRSSNDVLIGKYKGIVTEPVSLPPSMIEPLRHNRDDLNSLHAKLSRQSSYTNAMSNSASGSRSSIRMSRQNTLVSSEGSFKRMIYRQRSVTSNEEHSSSGIKNGAALVQWGHCFVGYG